MKKIIYIGLLLFAVQMTHGQSSRTNQIYRPCPGSTTPAKVDVQSGGKIEVKPCTTKGSNGRVTILSSDGLNSTLSEEGASGGLIEIVTGAGGVTTSVAESGSGGNIELTTGRGGASTVAAGNTSGTGGRIELSAGDGGDRTGASGTAGTGGNIIIDAGRGGTGTGGAANGTAGEIRIGTVNRSQIEIGTANSKTIIGDVGGTGNATTLTINDEAGEVAIGGNATLTIGNASPVQFVAGSGPIYLDRTLTTAGTTGNVTINKMAGTVNIAAGAGTAGVTVTNNSVTANSIVYVTARTNDATCAVKNVVPAAGSFVLRTTANCTAETSFGFFVTN